MNYHHTRFIFDKSRAKVWKAINEYLQKHIKNNAKVLDIGCGYGDFINGIKAGEKFAIDLNPEMKKYIDIDNIKFHDQSVLEPFNFVENNFEVIFASNLFEHFNDEELLILINSIKNKLSTGGKLILIQPNYYYAYREYWDDYTHKKAFSHNSIHDFLIANDFKIIKLEKKFIPFSLKSKLPKSYFLTKMYLNTKFRIFAKQMLIIAELK
jgi:SAM-dependent methyltransferase